MGVTTFSDPILTAGPAWTVERVRTATRVVFGPNSKGGPDPAALAAATGVSVRTAQRWLQGDEADSPAHLPTTRVEDFVSALLPEPIDLRRERQSLDQAQVAMEAFERPRQRGVLPVWRERGWDQRHVVSILKVTGLPICQIANTRVGARTTHELTRRATIADDVIVPTRFHGEVLVYRVLEALRPWRIKASRDLVGLRANRTWLDDAPPMDLLALTGELGIYPQELTNPQILGSASNDLPRETPPAPNGPRPSPSLAAIGNPRTARAHLQPAVEALQSQDSLTAFEAISFLLDVADTIAPDAPGGKKAIAAAMRLRAFVHRSSTLPEVREVRPEIDPRLADPLHYNLARTWPGPRLARLLVTDFLI